MGALTDAHGGLAETRDVVLAEARAFQGPCLVDHVQEVLPIGAYHLAFIGDNDGGVVVLRRCGPSIRDVNLLWKADNDMTVVFESS